MTEIKNFSSPKREPLRFQIDDDIFEAVPEVGAGVLQSVISMTDASELTSLVEQSQRGGTPDPEQIKRATSAGAQMTTRMLSFLDSVLLEESAARFSARLQSTTEPISINQALQVWQWLIGEYGTRPTQPSLSSANGHDGSGSSSTAGAPAAG